MEGEAFLKLFVLANVFSIVLRQMRKKICHHYIVIKSVKILCTPAYGMQKWVQHIFQITAFCRYKLEGGHLLFQDINKSTLQPERFRKNRHVFFLYCIILFDASLDYAQAQNSLKIICVFQQTACLCFCMA